MPNDQHNSCCWIALVCAVRKFIVDYLHIEPLSFGIVLLLISSLAFLSLIMPMICCYNRRRSVDECTSNGKNYQLSSSNDSQNAVEGRRHLLHLMFAKLDEFESLTPLIITPSASSAESKHVVVNKTTFPTSSPTILQLTESTANSATVELGETVHNSHSGSFLEEKSLKHLLYPPTSPSTSFARREQERSPPPLRRCSSGKTMIVPLCSNRPMARQPFIIPAGGRAVLSSFECNAASVKSCETIPEDNELEFETISEVSRKGRTDEEGTSSTSITEDLLSIDRTYISTNDFYIHNPSTKHQIYYAPSPKLAPQFKMPPPAYSPPAPPPNTLCTPSTISCKIYNLEASNKVLELVDHDGDGTPANHSMASVRSNLSSPEPSSSCNAGLFDSPIDTTIGSLSDSFLIPEGDLGALRQQQEHIMVSELDLSSSIDNKYALHRIEEESEHLGGSRCLGTSSIFSNNESSHIKRNNNNNNGSNQKFIIPRSISQQLEIMNNAK